MTISGGSGINSNDILRSVTYPDTPANDAEVYEVNALGQCTKFTDRNGTTHVYTYDVLGRLTFDEVTTLATGVNGEVRKLGFTYDSAGRPEKFTSYNAGGAVKNQVQRVYNGFGQLLTEYQEHSTTVSTATSPKVQYGYSTVTSTSNASNRTTVTYPNDEYFITYLYQFGRLTGVDEWDTDQLERLGYLGLDSVVRRYWHNADDLAMAYTLSGGGTGEAGDKYTGLDRFGRVIEHRWDAASGGTLDAFKYGYDRNGNRLYRDNLLNNNFDELYHADGESTGYDNLNRLTDFQRGPLSDTNSDGVPDTVATASRSQVWSLDALGNWDSLTNDGGAAQTRTHNSQNQLTAVGANNLTYDANGNMTTDETGQTLVYDAWNRLMSVTPSGGSAKSYCYDALGRRIKETPAGGSTRDLYYSDQWQVLEERVGGVTTTRYAWSPVYVDAMIVRQHDADADGTIAYEERLYALQDANYNVTGLFDMTNGWPAVVERFIYDPYGSVTVLDANWATDADGQSDVGWVYLHQGGRFDWTTGLYHFRNRDYDPELGRRWMRQDPAGYVDGMSLHEYVQSNPGTGLDALGLQVMDPIEQQWYLENLKDYEPKFSFYDHYFLGNGEAVDLAEIGLLEAWQNDPSVAEGLSDIRRSVRDFGEPSCEEQDRVVSGVLYPSVVVQSASSRRRMNPFDQLYPIGNSTLTVRYNLRIQTDCACCIKDRTVRPTRVTVSGTITFEMNDMFTNPFDIGGPWNADPRGDLPGSAPYDIRARWTENVNFERSMDPCK